MGGLTSNTTDEMMREFYGKFGELTDVIVMRDPTTKRSRGFGFITFTSKACVSGEQIERMNLCQTSDKLKMSAVHSALFQLSDF